jgi:hypothetical protein
MGTHLDGADPAVDISGLVGARGLSCRGGGRDVTGGDVQGATSGAPPSALGAAFCEPPVHPCPPARMAV